MPFEDNTFDAYTIAFGLRNVTHIDKALVTRSTPPHAGGHTYTHLHKNTQQKHTHARTMTR